MTVTSGFYGFARAVDPVLPFAFLQSLVDVLEEYFGSISEAVIKDSFDLVLQVRRLQYLLASSANMHVRIYRYA